MTTENATTEIVFVIDRSGSMEPLVSDTIGGFNSTLKRYRDMEGKVTVTTVLFNYESKTVYEGMPVAEVPEMTAEDYVPCGGTALLDAVGDAVMRRHMAHSGSGSPAKTVFVIITDGYENSSRTHTYASVKKMIEDSRKECGWEFVFLGANIDVAAEASRMGISVDDAVRFDADAKGVRTCYRMVCNRLDRVL